MWKTLHGALPMMVALYHRYSSASPTCPLCHIHDESVEHLFLLCPWVAAIWFGGALTYRVNRNANTSWGGWLVALFQAHAHSNEDLQRVMSYIAFSCWHIWKARCRILFQRKPINPFQVLSNISTSGAGFLTAMPCSSVHNVHMHSQSDGQVSWLPPPFPFYKNNVNASWDAGMGGGYVGVVIRDSFGNFLAATRKSLRESCVAAVEAVAVQYGYELGHELGQTHVVLESDSQQSISCLRGSLSNGIWEAFPILARCLKFGEAFQDCCWPWIPR